MHNNLFTSTIILVIDENLAKSIHATFFKNKYEILWPRFFFHGTCDYNLIKGIFFKFKTNNHGFKGCSCVKLFIFMKAFPFKVL